MNSVKKNFMYNVIYQILILLTPLITAPIISRALGSEGLGIFTYTTSVVEYFLLFAMLGFQNHGIRSISRVRDNEEKVSKQFWSIYYLQIIVTLIVVAVYLIYIFFITQKYFWIYLIHLMIILSSLFDVSWFFYGMEEFKIMVFRNIVIRILVLLAVIFFVKRPEHLWLHTSIIAFSSLLTTFSLWIFLRKYIFFVRFNFNDVIKNLRPALIFFIPNLAVGAYIIMDKVMIGQLATVSQVAYYSNAEKITNIPMGIIGAFATVMLPRSSYLARSGDFEKVKNSINISMEFSTFLGSLFMFGIVAVGPLFAPIFFGQEFAVSGQLTVFLAITILFKSWNSVIRTQYLIPFDMEKQFSLAVITGAVTNLILNIILIPRFNAQGAIFATILSEFSVLAVEMYYSKNNIEYKKIIVKNSKYIFIGAIMYFVIRFSQNFLGVNLISIFIQAVIGGIFYLLLSFLVYDNKQSVIAQIKQILKEIVLKIKRKG